MSELEKERESKLKQSRPSSRAFLLVGLVLLGLTVTLSLGYYLWREFPSIDTGRSTASNLGFFLLININIIVMILLMFLVSKNIITLILDRRRNKLGSRLRTRLVLAFVMLSLLPTVLLFLVAKGILESVFEAWFSPQIATSVDGALKVAKYHSDFAAEQLLALSEQIVSDIESRNKLQETKAGSKFKFDFREPLIKQLQKFDLAALEVYNPRGELIAGEYAEDSAVTSSLELSAERLGQALRGHSSVQPEHDESSQEFLRSYVGLFSGAEPFRQAQAVAVFTKTVDANLGSLLREIINSYEDYNELRTYRRPLASAYLLTLIVVTLLIIFAAVWLGFYLSRGLSVPIGLLAEATAEVAQGNLSYKIPDIGDDELSVLVRSFNKMTQDLNSITEELETRRRYMEAVLVNVGVGIVSVDSDLRIQALNIAAKEMLGLSAELPVFGRELFQTLPAELSEQLRPLLEDLLKGQEKTLAANVNLSLSAQPKTLALTLTRLAADSESKSGVVILLDNITDLISAQRLAAWREVARRIAHEIKNPLTPIQLCAERLARKVDGDESQKTLVRESTDIILKQVENLRSLVNEFSRFARMPKLNPKLADINQLLAATISVYREAHPEVSFLLDLDPALPEFHFDPEGINRVFINLIDNALAALKERAAEGRDFSPEISLSSTYDPSLSMVSIALEDNGIGVRDEDKPKLFEPYFSRKAGGTGLGLAIVSSLVADHRGFIRIKDKSPRGLAVVVELPIV